MNPPDVAPRVSIILPVYNGQEFLDEALASLVNQTLKDFELLIINDGSTDNSVAVIERWVAKDHRLRLIQNGEPHGLPQALNAGLRQARGEYIARADQDDRHRPDRLAQEVAFLDQHQKIMLVGTAYQPFNQDGQRPLLRHPAASPIIAWKMLSASAFCHPTVVFRRQVYEKLGGYPVTGAEDFAYFSKVVCHWPAANLSHVLIDYREHATNYSLTRKEAITISIMETFQENIRHYFGTADQAPVLYDFLVRRYLPLRHWRKVKIMCLEIIRNIGRTYALSSLAPSMVGLYFLAVKELLVVSLRTLFRLPALGPALYP
ncbi:MAG: glycosyltransferase family 2 protein [Candidatus Kerfeldbacteria bacterium]|nr:glycosyltransferase family 2 protein [Candidatus Kerfeldbacteria bacterium]